MFENLFPFLPGPANAPSLFGQGQGGIGSDYALGQILEGGNAYQAPGTVAGIQGGNAANIPLPVPRPPGLGGQPMSLPGEPTSLAPPSPGPTTPSGNVLPSQAVASGLQNAVRGMQAIQPPQAQRVATPRAPELGRVPPSEIINTLSALGIGPQQAVGMGLGRRF